MASPGTTFTATPGGLSSYFIAATAIGTAIAATATTAPASAIQALSRVHLNEPSASLRSCSPFDGCLGALTGRRGFAQQAGSSFDSRLGELLPNYDRDTTPTRGAEPTIVAEVATRRALIGTGWHWTMQDRVLTMFLLVKAVLPGRVSRT